MDIREALSQLDTLDDAVWTAEGFPKIEAVKELLGHPVSRQDIINAAPQFSRSNPIVDEKPDQDPDFELPEVEDDLSMLDVFADSAPMQPEAFLGFLKTVPKEGLQELLEILRQQQLTIGEQRKKLDEMDHLIRIATLHTKNRINREIPDVSDGEANRAYLKRQQELRAAKHAATTALLKGMDLKSLDPRSPIDRAMARKNARGTKRPTLGMKV
jgi:hypothetical protein